MERTCFAAIACILALSFITQGVQAGLQGLPRNVSYDTVGCYKDTGHRAIEILEGRVPIINESYYFRNNPIEKCAVAAMTVGYSMFALQDGGECFGSATAPQTFDKYGKSDACRADGTGGPWANQVYVIKSYDTVGCYKDTGERAIEILEGRVPILNGSYSSRNNSIAKCAVAAMRVGYNMFAVQDGGQCFGSAAAPQTFDKYGESDACGADGEGGPGANQVYVIKGYGSVGCYKDTEKRAIKILEGKDPILDGPYSSRKNSIEKCAVAAMRVGYNMFAVQYGGQCFGSATAPQTFDKYGKSDACGADGEGGYWANQVYVMKGYETVGCYNDTGERAIEILEGKDPMLDGSHSSRKNPIAKCSVAAMRVGYSMFAVRNGGECFGSATAPHTFDKSGKSDACGAEGAGGPWANQVYVIKGYDTVGCYQDTKNRAIKIMERTDPILDGPYSSRKNPIAKCAVAAMRVGYSVFAVQDGGECFGSAAAPQTFDKYGKSDACEVDGKGGPLANQVYVIKGYDTIGCYRDARNRAIRILEGKDRILDGSYSSRKNPIAKCAVAAMRMGYSIFSVQYGGQCFGSALAPQTFDKYGKSDACKADGTGGIWANEVYIIKDYDTVGCYNDTRNRAIRILEGKDRLLYGLYLSRKNPVEKCAVAAMRLGYNMFSVQDGGQCFGSSTAPQTFDKYGKSDACRADGEGGPWANEVYVIKRYETVGCYKDAGHRAIKILEGTDPILNGSYSSRKNPIAKCAVAAMRMGYSMFAVQDGGECFGSATAPQTFDKYGKSDACGAEGTGGPWANQVYVIKAPTTVTRQPTAPSRCIEEKLEGVPWSSTARGGTDIKPCPNGASGNASRKCSKEGAWKNANFTGCSSSEFNKLGDAMESIIGGFQSDLNAQQVLSQLANISQPIKNNSERPSRIYGGDLVIAVDILVKLAKYNGNQGNVSSAEDFKNYAQVASNLLESTNNITWKDLEKAGQGKSQSLVKAMDEYGLGVAATFSESTKPRKVQANNLAMRIDRVDQDSPLRANGLKVAYKQSSIYLPPQAFSSSQDSRVVTVVYLTLNDVLPLTKETEGKDDQTFSANTTIVSSTIVPRPPDELSKPVKVVLQNRKRSIPAVGPPQGKCVFWRPGETAMWKTSGCKMVPTESDVAMTTCECDHLTIFAALMDPFGSEVGALLGIISTVGCSISLLAVVITMAVTLFFWKGLKSPRAKVLLNLCAAIAVTCALVIAEGSARNKAGCAVVAALLHYFLLALFSWMLCEGVLHYILLVKVFGGGAEDKVKYFYLFGWGFPAIVVTISLAVTQANGYGDKEACWLDVKSGLIWAFIAPALLVILINIVVYILVILQMKGTRYMKNKTQIGKLKAGVKASAVILPLLGITWLFGLLSFNLDIIVFKYIFTVFNSLQGLMIFIFHCALNKQVQDAVKRRLEEGSAGLSSNPNSKPTPYRKGKLVAVKPLSQATKRRSNRAEDDGVRQLQRKNEFCKGKLELNTSLPQEDPNCIVQDAILMNKPN